MAFKFALPSANTIVAAVAILVVALVAGWYFVGRLFPRSGSHGSKESFFALQSGPTGNKKDGFAVDGKAVRSMSPKERELFQNLQNNNYTTAQIDDMIQTGILNAKVVNKFLAALNVVV